MNRHIRYPIYYQPKLLDRIALKIGAIPVVFCPVCGNLAPLVRIRANLRESCFCIRCMSTNRQRQIAYVLCRSLARIEGRRIRCLKDIATGPSPIIYNCEAHGAIHDALAKMRTYIFSEYYGPEHNSGDTVDGVLHEDLLRLSFQDESIDIVLSSDVLEHIPRPYDAHREIWRVLKPNGRHVFTVPFYQTEFLDETRAFHDDDGELRLIKEPQHHDDPLRPEGALVYTIFSLQMLIELRRIGFHTNMYRLYRPWHGILGSNAIVFEAIKAC